MQTEGKNRKRSKILRVASAVAAFVVVLACNSPFIPIPPPNPTFAPTVVPDCFGGTREDWSVSGPPNLRGAGARVYTYNARAESGLIVKAADDGSYAAYPLYGQRNDPIQIYWDRGAQDRSLTICRNLTEGTATKPCQ
jgi:hypothetical protein